MSRSRKVIVGSLAVVLAGAGAAIVIGLREKTIPGPAIVARIASATRDSSGWRIEATAFNRSYSVVTFTDGQVQFRHDGQWKDVWNPIALEGVKTDWLPPRLGFTNKFRIPLEASHVRVRWLANQQTGLGIRSAWACWQLGLRPASHPRLWKLLNRLPINRDVPREITTDEMPLPPPAGPTLLPGPK